MTALLGFENPLLEHTPVLLCVTRLFLATYTDVERLLGLWVDIGFGVGLGSGQELSAAVSTI